MPSQRACRHLISGLPVHGLTPQRRNSTPTARSRSSHKTGQQGRKWLVSGHRSAPTRPALPLQAGVSTHRICNGAASNKPHACKIRCSTNEGCLDSFSATTYTRSAQLKHAVLSRTASNTTCSACLPVESRRWRHQALVVEAAAAIASDGLTRAGRPLAVHAVLVLREPRQCLLTREPELFYLVKVAAVDSMTSASGTPHNCTHTAKLFLAGRQGQANANLQFSEQLEFHLLYHTW